MLARHLKHRHSWIIAGCFRFGKGSFQKNCKVFFQALSASGRQLPCARRMRAHGAGPRVSSPSMPRRTASSWTPWSCCWTRSRSCWRTPSSRSCSFRRSCSSRSCRPDCKSRSSRSRTGCSSRSGSTSCSCSTSCSAARCSRFRRRCRNPPCGCSRPGKSWCRGSAQCRRCKKNRPYSKPPGFPSVPILWIGIGEKIFPPIHPMHQREKLL